MSAEPDRRFPEILYKYCDPKGVDILDSNRVKVTPCDKFNDPFELMPRMRPDFPKEGAKRAVSNLETQRMLYEGTLKANKFSGSFEEFVALLSSLQDQLGIKMAADYPADAKEFRDDYIQSLNRQFGLICLSEVPDDILMWGHYTDRHTGFVIGFKANDSFLLQPPIHQVEYAEERVLVGHYYDPRETRQPGEIVEELVRRKSRHWRYEKEWRQLRQLDACDAISGRYYVSVAPSAISEVITGCRCNTAAIDAALSKPEFKHVRRRRAVLHDTDFKLVFVE